MRGDGECQERLLFGSRCRLLFWGPPCRGEAGTLSALLHGAPMVGCQRARGLGFSVVVLYPGCMLESLMEIGGRWGEFLGCFF